MNCKICLIAILVNMSVVLSAPPVFLAGGGKKVCTLNNVGKIPAGALQYPVYQKVCRNIIPTLGDEAVDDETDRLDDAVEAYTNDEEVEKVRRAILGSAKVSKENAKEKSNIRSPQATFRIPEQIFKLNNPINFGIDVVVSN